MAVIVIGGMIALGKSSTAEVLAEHFGTDVFYEKVEGNEVLPLFYTASEEEQEKYRYPFLLQLEFLNSRFTDIKNSLYDDNNVIDRSIYEDYYFAKVNNDLGNISDLEFSIYQKLLNNMMQELQELPKKSPDVFIYLRASFDKVLERIKKRGREFEQDEELINYYYKLWSGYDDWVLNYYNYSDVLVVDMDEMDVVNNPKDAVALCNRVEQFLEDRKHSTDTVIDYKGGRKVL